MNPADQPGIQLTCLPTIVGSALVGSVHVGISEPGGLADQHRGCPTPTPGEPRLPLSEICLCWLPGQQRQAYPLELLLA